MRDLVIIGAGDFGREVAALVERINDKSPICNLKGFVDDNEPVGKEIFDYEVLGGLEYFEENSNVWVVCSISTCRIREKIIGFLDDRGVNFATLIDPSAEIFRSSTIGNGSIICSGSIVTVNCSIGEHVIVNLNCTIGHDDIIEDFCTLNPGVNVSGRVKLMKCTNVGTGTKIIQGKNICEDVTLGAGSVVIKDITEAGVYVGMPVVKKK